VNGDGKLDIVVAEASSSNAFAVHLGNGDGTFQMGTEFGPATGAYLVQLADMNGDGKLDIIAVTTDGNLYYLQGNGDGTFQPAVSVAATSGASNVTVGDFDGDGILDIVYADGATGNVILLRGVGDGTFHAPQSFTPQTPTGDTAAADFNEDGWLDVLAGTSVGVSSGSASTVLLNNTSGGFLPSSAVGLSYSLQGIAVGDLKGDGHMDAISSGANGLTVSYGNGDGTFSAPSSYDPSDFFSNSPLVGNYVTGGSLGVSVASLDTGELVVLLPTVSISPSPSDFGSVAINSTAGPQTLTITNETPTTISLSGATLSGADASDFAITGSTCGGTLGPGVSCTSSVSFTPLAPGALTATFTLTDSAAGGSQTAQLTGTGAVAPAVLLTPASVAFPVGLLNSTSSAMQVTLKNNGDATLNIASVAVAGSDPGDFNQNTTCGATVAVGASCSINVTFTPTAARSDSANITIMDDALTSPQTVVLSGTGVTDTVQMSTNSLVFAGQADGTTSGAQTVTLTNVGSSALNIASITIAGTNGSDFAQTNNCGSSVASQATCAIHVTFAPTAAGSLAGTLTINDNSPKGPHTVGLSGTGEDFTFTVSAAQTVAQGAIATFQLAVTPEDNFGQQIAFSCINTIVASTCSVSPTSVTPSGSSSSTINLTVTTTGPSSGALLPNFPRGNPGIRLSLLAVVTLFLLVLFAWQNLPAIRVRGVMLALMGCAVIVAVQAAGCGGHRKYTPAGSYTVTVTATSGSVSHSVSAQITVQ
jgi:hypothetical protein